MGKQPKTKKEKIALGINIAVWSLAVVLIVLAIFSKQIFGEESFFGQIFGSSGEDGSVSLWDKVVAFLPALLKGVIGIVVVYAVSKLLRVLLNKALKNTKKGLTVGKLIDSFVKYAAAIVIVFMVLAMFGVNTGTLLASAGILGLVVGLGAQSLIADIIAGLFIIFESEFQVDDIVVIDDWRGTVQSIGLRSTKIIDAGGNVKVINNSQINSVINMTSDLSMAKCIIGTEYGDSIERVEVVIKKNIENIKAQVPAIIDGPFYKGITSLSASSVDLLFVAKCKEEDIYQVQRDLNRALKLMFDKNNINVPFPQIVLNQPQELTQTVSARQKKVAAEFVEEQKELSKNLENEILNDN